MALESIVRDTRADLAARRTARPLAELLEGLEPSDRPFESALRAEQPAFILEIKPASPSKGPIRPVTDLDPVLRAYREFATAISVVTDQRYFGGSYELLSRVRAQVTQPVLCKGFILDPYQVVEARRAGADAVLLMLSVLDDEEYRTAAAAAHRLRMAVLTEVHTAAELARATRLGASIIGINNRDLGSLRTDLGVTERLAPLAPPAALLIAESGLASNADVRRLGNAVDGFLIGSALMAASDPARAVRKMIFGSTKVCGLTSPSDAVAAWQCGATHGGLVFAGESPRRVSVPVAGAIRAAAPLQWTGVFVNETTDRIAATVRALDLAAVQLHGDEDADFADRLRSTLPARTEIWKAVPVAAGPPRPAGTSFDRCLFDRADPGRRGGTGRPFDWDLIRGVNDPNRTILGGGLTPSNAGAAANTGVTFLDVSSGVERTPGQKSLPALIRFFAARRSTR